MRPKSRPWQVDGMKRLLAFLKEPPLWFLIIWYVLTAGLIAGSALLASSAQENAPHAGAVYGFTALSLAYAIYMAVQWVPRAKHAAKERLRRNKYTESFLESYSLRTVVWSALSMLLNFAYVVVNGVTAVQHHSRWYYALSAYYFALMLIRLVIIGSAGRALKKYGRESREFARRKLDLYLICGVLLLVLEVSLSAVVTLMIVLPRETDTGLPLAIANAAYTFWKLVLAIVNKVKAGKTHEPVTQALRSLTLTDALVSMFSLQITLSAAAGGSLPLQFNAAVGFGVCLFTVFLGIYMIFDGIRRKKKFTASAEPAPPKGQEEKGQEE